MDLKTREYSWAAVGIFGGICASVAISPKDPTYFFPNFAVYWGSQLLVIGVFFLFSQRAVIVGGFSFALSVYIYCFHSLLSASQDPNASLAWIYYFFLLPFALISGLAADFYVRKKSSLSPSVAFVVTASSVLVGVTTIPAIIWGFRLAGH